MNLLDLVGIIQLLFASTCHFDLVLINEYKQRRCNARFMSIWKKSFYKSNKNWLRKKQCSIDEGKVKLSKNLTQTVPVETTVKIKDEKNVPFY